MSYRTILLGAAALVLLSTHSAAAADRVGHVTTSTSALHMPLPVTSAQPVYVKWARSFQVPLPRAHVYQSPCPNAVRSQGCANPPTGEIWLAYLDRHGLAHELGHIFDAQHLNSAVREQFTALLGASPTTTWEGMTGDECLMQVCPSELFADAYAACALDMTPQGRWLDSYGYKPTVSQHRRVCAMIRSF